MVLTAEERAQFTTAGCELVHIETEPGDMVLFSSRTIHCGRRAREPTTDWRFATYVCMAPASTLCEADRQRLAQRKARVMGLIPWPHKAGRHQDVTAETTAHPPSGKSIKPRFGWDRTTAPPGVSNGITEAPELAKTPEALQLAGVLPYSGGGHVADVAGMRAKRLKRLSKPEVIAVDDEPLPEEPKPAADEATVVD